MYKFSQFLSHPGMLPGRRMPVGTHTELTRLGRHIETISTLMSRSQSVECTLYILKRLP